MIDCDIHPQLGDPEEGLLPYIEPAQRDWFRLQGPTLGLPGYPWNHPTSFFRQDLDHEEAQPPSATVAEVVRDVLDPFGVDVGVLNGDEGIYVSLDRQPIPGGRVRARAQRLDPGAVARRRPQASRRRSSARHRIRSPRRRRSGGQPTIPASSTSS